MRSGDQKIAEPVAVDVAGIGNGVSGQVVGGNAVDPESVDAVEIADGDVGGKPAPAAEQDIGPARVGIGAIRAKDEVGKTIAVQVAGRRNGLLQ